MLRPNAPNASFSVGQTRAIIKDLFQPTPAIYWTDFLLSFLIGSICFSAVRRVTPYSATQLLAFAVSVVLYYRSATFVHELAHLRSGQFKTFRFVWNLLCGVPFLTPSFTYYSHVDHHMRRHFGTDHDGEYLPLGTMSPWQILLYLCQPLVIPLLGVTRFLLLAPLGWLSPRLRRLIQQRASSLVMDPRYIRPLPSRQNLRVFRWQEVGCFLVCLGAVVLLVRGRLPQGFLIQAYATAVAVLYLNHLRTLGSHRYTNSGDEMTFVGQLLDSVTFSHSRFSGMIWAPLGMRFHALHHLFPTLPYHNLAAAHRRLSAELPADHPYRQTESPSLPAAIWQLVRAARAVQASERPAASPSTARELCGPAPRYGRQDLRAS